MLKQFALVLLLCIGCTGQTVNGLNIAGIDGNDEYGGETQAIAGDITPYTFAGVDAYSFVVHPGDIPLSDGHERSEWRFKPNISAGTEQWYAWKVAVPTGCALANPYIDIFTQWHSTGLTGNPNLQFYIAPVTNKLVVMTTSGIYGGTPVNWSQNIADFAFDTWYDLKLHVVWSPTSTGLVEVWVNDVLAQTHTGANMYWTDSTMTTSYDVYPKQGFYRSNISGVSTVYETPLRENL